MLELQQDNLTCLLIHSAMSIVCLAEITLTPNIIISSAAVVMGMALGLIPIIILFGLAPFSVDSWEAAFEHSESFLV